MTTEHTLNVPMLRKYVEWVEEQEARPIVEREWLQAHWAITLEDAKSILATAQERAAHFKRIGDDHMAQAYQQNADTMQQDYIPQLQNCGTAYCLAGKIVSDAGYAIPAVDCPEEAANLLGLDYQEASPLWDAGNRAEDIRRIATRITLDLTGEKL